MIKYNIKLLDSNVFISSSVIKDENTFSVHLIDPKLDSDKQQQDNSNLASSSSSNLDSKSNRESSVERDDANKNSIAKYVGFTGVLKSGLSLSMSNQYLTQKSQKSSPLPPTSVTLAASTLESGSFLVQSHSQPEEKEKQSKKTIGKEKKGGKKEAPVDQTVRFTRN
jgi:hypothetical protein